MILLYFILSSVLILPVFLSGKRSVLMFYASVYYLVQAVFLMWIFFSGFDTDSSRFFRFDTLGVLIHAVMVPVSTAVFYQSIRYLNNESLKDLKLYHGALILLCVSLTGVYYSDNVVLSWAFLEATTLATAGLVYHRRTARSLEATWKYVFVSSVGISIAYLGILLLSTAVTGEESMSFRILEQAVVTANPLYMKMAFLLILTGFSCKMETFPLYSIGVDANYAAPTPASALISTGLVNAGFISLFRVYRIMEGTDFAEWCRGTLVVAGLLSVLVGALYLRRTNNFKRFLSYSTVENMGIVLIGIGLGKVGAVAALFHILVHSLLKSGMFMQMAQIGRLYGTYRMNRTGDYFRTYPLGAVAVALGMVGLLAFHPSGLFISELLMLKEMAAQGRWFLIVVFTLLACLIIYTLSRRFSALLMGSCTSALPKTEGINPISTLFQLLLITAALLVGILQPDSLFDLLNGIIS